MNGWNNEEYLNNEIKEIQELKEKGSSDKEIMNLNKFSFTALKACNMPISYLVPKAEHQELSLEDWDTHTSYEHKWEYYDSLPFGNKDEMDRVLMGLIYSSGFKNLIKILPDESKRDLFKLIKEMEYDSFYVKLSKKKEQVYKISKSNLDKLRNHHYQLGYYEHPDFMPHTHKCELKLLDKSLKKYCPVKGRISEDEHECDYCEHFIVINFVKNTESTKIQSIERTNDKK